MSDEEQSHDEPQLNFKERDEDDSKPKFDISQSKKNIPVKTEIRHMEKDRAELRADLNENKECGMTRKGELISLEGDRCLQSSSQFVEG